MSPGLPFAHLNLRRNPFGELRRQEWSAVAVVDIAPLAQWLEQPRRALQLLAPPGRGKTTHLRAIGRHLPGSHFVRAVADSNVTCPPGAVLLLDEADFAPWVRRHMALRRARSVAIATHTDLSFWLRLAGHEVRSVRVSTRDPGHIREIWNRRIRTCRRSEGPIPQLSRRDVQHLIATHGDDLRAMEHDLYEHFQSGAVCVEV